MKSRKFLVSNKNLLLVPPCVTRALSHLNPFPLMMKLKLRYAFGVKLPFIQSQPHPACEVLVASPFRGGPKAKQMRTRPTPKVVKVRVVAKRQRFRLLWNEGIFNLP